MYDTSGYEVEYGTVLIVVVVSDSTTRININNTNTVLILIINTRYHTTSVYCVYQERGVPYNGRNCLDV